MELNLHQQIVSTYEDPADYEDEIEIILILIIFQKYLSK